MPDGKPSELRLPYCSFIQYIYFVYTLLIYCIQKCEYPTIAETPAQHIHWPQTAGAIDDNLKQSLVSKL